MINPNNAIGTNGAFGGRTSVNAFNDDLASYSTGILSGWACEPSSGLTVILGGDGNTRDVAIAEDNAGNKTTINNISGSPVSVTIGSAPNSNSRIDSIVAYVNNPPTGTSTATDNYGACGLIVVAGTVSSNPSAPSESSIRAAITADGASGTTAYYVVLANITISSGTTDLTSANITQGSKAQIGANNIDFTTFSTTDEIECGTWINGKTIYKKTVYFGSLPNNSNKSVAHGISGIEYVVKIEGINNTGNAWSPLPLVFRGTDYIWNLEVYVDLTNITMASSKDLSSRTAYLTIYYTKTN